MKRIALDHSMRAALLIALVALLQPLSLEAQFARRVADVNPDLWLEERGGVCGHVQRLVVEEFASVLFADRVDRGCEVLIVDPVGGELEAVANLGEWGGLGG